jgi:hypothetical protein
MGRIARLLEEQRQRTFDHRRSLAALARGINIRAATTRGPIRRWFVLEPDVLERVLERTRLAQPAISIVTRSSRRTFADRK